MGYRMNDKEFDKLWDKFDTDGFHAISSDKFVQRLTNDQDFRGNEQSIPTSEAQDQQIAILKSQPRRSSRLNCIFKVFHLCFDIFIDIFLASRSQLDENQIGKWLNHKFPHGFGELERALEQADLNKRGLVKNI